MLANLSKSLLEMQELDLSVRAELAADGSVPDGYHPRMEAVHRANARKLRALIATHGWPNETLAGGDGAEAAWLVAQHAIAEPAFMRSCRDLLSIEAQAGSVPRWQHAYLYDRIQVFEGKPQRFGTQFEIKPEGPIVCEVEAPERLDKNRKKVGLEPMRDRLNALINSPRPSPEDFKARKTAEQAWKFRVGWLTVRDGE